jgi:sporulation protein YlmC with PRC-barrel domain
MLRSLKSLEHYKISATDGELGKVADFLLDDERWIVRYLIADTGGFFGGRRVLVSPISFREIEWPTSRFHLALTMEKIKNSPDIDVDKPVSRQYERDYLGYYGYPSYWGYSGMWGMGTSPGLLADGTMNKPAVDTVATRPSDVHLRSADEIRGYHVQGSDEAIGHVEDFVVDDETWAIRYLVIDTRNWWFGKKVLISPRWASGIRWAERTVDIDLSRQAIKSSPEWDPNALIDREYENRLHSYYGRPPYWVDERPPTESPNRPQSHPRL